MFKLIMFKLSRIFMFNKMHFKISVIKIKRLNIKSK